jgi:hypothetical protein
MSSAQTMIQRIWRSGTGNPGGQLKLLGAILILLGLVLPLYSCRGRFVDTAGREVHYVDQNGAVLPGKDLDLHQPLPPGIVQLDASKPLPPGVTYHKNYHFFLGDFSYDDPFEWFRLAGFLWPMAAALFATGLKHRWSRRLFLGFEPILVLESSMALSTSAILGTLEIGFWAAWSGIILYSLGAARSDMAILSERKPPQSHVWKVVSGILIYGVFLACSAVSVMMFFKWLVK